MDNIALGITGASGSILAKRLLEYLANLDTALHIVCTANGRAVFRHETGAEPEGFIAGLGRTRAKISLYGSGDMFAPIASGSFPLGAMAVVPCSMATAAKLASGVTDNLLTRAADVCLKEGIPLVAVPRETPLHSGHLRSLLALSELGAKIVPPMPAFYGGETELAAVIDGITGRILKSMGLPNSLYRVWGEPAAYERTASDEKA